MKGGHPPKEDLAYDGTADGSYAVSVPVTVRVASLHVERCQCHDFQTQCGGLGSGQAAGHVGEGEHPLVDPKCSEMWDALMKDPSVRLIWDGAPLLPGKRTGL